MVAICVLSPISIRKNDTSVAPKAPKRLNILGAVSSLSGSKAQTAIARKETTSTPRKTSSDRRSPANEPNSAARLWLTSVAAKIPRMMGMGARNRAANTIASSCVLSPSSANATAPADTSNVSTSKRRCCGNRPRQTPPCQQEGEQVQGRAEEEMRSDAQIGGRQAADLGEDLSRDQRTHHG